MKKGLLILVLFSSLVWSCEKPQAYPVEPQIEFLSFNTKDTFDILDNKSLLGELFITFVDGDGDLGLTPADTSAPYDTSSIYHYNVYVNLYAKENNKFVKQDLIVPLRYIMPDVRPKGQNKTLKGKIGIDLTYYYPLSYDTIKYEIYIFDRALHKSNVVTTPEFILE